jgi:hypothetical protein
MTPEQLQERENRLRKAFIENDFGDAATRLNSAAEAGLIENKDAFLKASAVAGWAGAQMNRPVNPAAPDWQGIKDGIARGYFKRKDAQNVTDEEIFTAISDDYKTKEATFDIAARTALAGIPLNQAMAELDAKRSSPMTSGIFDRYTKELTRRHSALATKLAPYRGLIQESVNVLTPEINKNVPLAAGGAFQSVAERLLSVPDEMRPLVISAIGETGGKDAKERASYLSKLAGAFGRMSETVGAAAGTTGAGISETLSQLANAPAEIASLLSGGMSLQSEAAAQKERSKETEARTAKAQQMRNLTQQVRTVADSMISPIKGDGWWSQTGIDVARMVPQSAATIINPALGFGANLAYFRDTIAAQAKMENPALSYEQADAIGIASAPLNAAVETISALIPFGKIKLPYLQRWLQSTTTSIKNTARNFAIRTGAATAVEIGEEYAQSYIPLQIEELMGALNADVPNVDWEKRMPKFSLIAEQTWGPALVYSLVGGGAASIRDINRGRELAMDVDAMVATGIAPDVAEGIAKKAEAGDWSGTDAGFQASFTSDKKATTEEKAGALARFMEKQREAQKLLNRDAAEAENIGVAVIRDESGWKVRMSDGTTVPAESQEVATQMQRDFLMASSEYEAETTIAAVDELLRLKPDQRVEITAEVPTVGENGLVFVHPTTGQKREIKDTASIQNLRDEQMALADKEGEADVAQSILGENHFEFGRAVSTVFMRSLNNDGAANIPRIITALHEHVEASWRKGVALGKFTEQESRNAVATLISQLDPKRLGKKATQEELNWFDRASRVAKGEGDENLLREVISELAVRTWIGRDKTGERTGMTPGTILRALDSAVLTARKPAEMTLLRRLRAWVKAVGAYLRGVVATAKIISQAEQNGTVGDFTEFMDKLLGLTEQTREDAAQADQIRQQMEADGMAFSLASISDFNDADSFYRVIVGDAAFNDIVSSGVIRTNAQSKINQSEGLAAKLAARPTAFPSFSKGKVSVEYAKENPIHYIVVSTSPSIQASKQGRHGKGTTYFPTDENGNALNSLPASEAQVWRHIGNGQYEIVLDKGQQMEEYGMAFSVFGARAKPITAAPVVQMPDGAQLVGPSTFSITAYHGTPHKVDKFTTSKIGTGEGAQAYGWGLYFAEEREVGEMYRENVTDAKRERLPKFREKLAFWQQFMTETPTGSQTLEQWRDGRTKAETEIAKINQQIAALENDGNLYTVELLPDEDEFLDWDKPLIEQSEKIQKILLRVSEDGGGNLDEHSLKRMTGGQAYKAETNNYDGAFPDDEYSKALAEAGIPGIKYLDGFSRKAGDGTRNYVIFDEKLVKILEENGQTAGLTFSLSPVTTAQDAKYMAAVEAGDTEKVQRMVDAAVGGERIIKNASTFDFQTGVRYVVNAFHGSKSQTPITVFDKKKLGSNTFAESAKKGFFFAGSKETASSKDYYIRREFEASESGEEWVRDYNKAIKSLIREAVELTSAEEVNGLPFGSGEFVSEWGDISIDTLLDGSISDDPEYIISSRMQFLRDELAPALEALGVDAKADIDALSASLPDSYLDTSEGQMVNAYLFLNNPMVFDDNGNEYREQSYADRIDEALKNGHDSVIIKNTFDGGPLDTIFVVFDPSQIKSADPVTYDENGNAIPLSQRFNPESADIRFSLSPTSSAEQLANIIESIMQARPELAFKIRQRSLSDINRLIQNWSAERVTWKGDKIRPVVEKRTKASLDKEQAMRQATREAELVDAGMATLTPETLMAWSEGVAAMNDHPLIKQMLGAHGRLMSKTTAENLGKLKTDGKGKAGDYDGAGWIPPAWYAGAGAGIMPDVMAQNLYDDGLLNEPTPDALWNALNSVVVGQRAARIEYAKAESAVKDVEKKAREQAKAEAQQWRDDTEDMMQDDWSPRESLQRDARLFNTAMAAFPAEIRGKIVPGGMVKLTGQATERARYKTIEKAMQKAVVELEKFMKKEITQEVDSLLDRYSSQKGASGRMEGKLLSNYTELVDYANFIRNADVDTVANEEKALDAAIADSQDADETASLMSKIGVLRQFELWGDKDSVSMADAMKWLQDIVATGKLGKKILDEDRKAFLDDMRQIGQGSILQGDELNPAIADNITNLNKKVMRRVLLGMRGVLSESLWTTLQRLELIFGEDSKVLDYFAGKIINAANLSTDIKRLVESQKRDALTVIFNSDSKFAHARGIAELQKLKDSGVVISRVTKKKVKLDIDTLTKLADGTMSAKTAGLEQVEVDAALEEWAASERKTTVTIEKVTSRAAPTARKMSETQGIQWWLWSMQDASRKQMERDGWDADSFEQLEKFLSPEAKALGRWIAGSYQDAAGMIDPIYRKLFNAPLPRIKNYSPIYRRNMNAGGDVMDIDSSDMNSGLAAGFTKSRVNTTASLVESDALAVFLAHWENVSHWVAHAELMRDMKAILLDKDTAVAIRQKKSEGYLQRLKQDISTIEKNGTNNASELLNMSRFWRWLMQYRAYKGLAFRMSPIIKQTPALLNPLLADVPAHNYMMGMSRAFIEPQAFAREVSAMWKSDIIRRRIESGFSAESRLAIQGSSMTGSQAILAMQAGMMPMAWTDAGWTALGAAISFDYYRRGYISQGMTPEMADNAAIARVEKMIATSAQPSDVYARALYERSGNPFMRSMSMFVSDQRKALAIELMAIRRLATGKSKNKAMDVQRALVAHVVQAAVSQVMAGVIASLLGDDEDRDREWSTEQWTLALTLGPINGLFVLGRLVDKIGRGLLGLRVFPADDLASKAANDLLRGGKNMDELFSPDNPEEFMDALDSLSTAAAAGMSAAIGPAGGAVDVGANVLREARKIGEAVSREE